MKKEYLGKLIVKDYGESDDVLFISSEDYPLAEVLEWISGIQVSVRYWITDKEVSKDEAQEQFLRTLLGTAEAEFYARYSEITGYLWTDEELNVGGHDLLAELKANDGNFVILEIDSSPSAAKDEQ